MKKHRITSGDDPLYRDLAKLYDISFPLHERRTAEHQLTALKDERYHLLCFLDDGVLVGLVGLWHFDDYRYIEHYAINAGLRGKGYGSLLLQELLECDERMIILEIDPVVDGISEKRLRFYKNLGFVENSYPHSHPAYQDGFPPHELVVLTSRRAVTPSQYQKFKRDLDDIVMFKER